MILILVMDLTKVTPHVFLSAKQEKLNVGEIVVSPQKGA